MHKLLVICAHLPSMMTPQDRTAHQKGNLLSCLAGILTGFSLCILMPASMALQTNTAQWGLTFWQWILVLSIIAILTSCCSFYATKISYFAGLGYMRSTQLLVGNKVVRLPLGWFDVKSSGRLSKLVTGEMMSSGQAVAYFIGMFYQNVLATLIFCLSTWLWNWKLGAVLTLTIPVMFLLMMAGHALVGKGHQMTHPAEEELAARIVEFGRCQAALRACHVNASYKELDESFAKSRSTGIKSMWISILGNILSGMSMQLVIVSLILTAVGLCTAGITTPLEAVIAIGVALRFAVLLSDVSNNILGLEERYEAIVDTNATMEAAELSVPQNAGMLPEDGSLELENVSFTYASNTASSSSQQQPMVINNMSFKVPESNMLAIVGPSGCGKTTLFKLIARFYDTTKGSVKIGGVDVRNLSSETLFKQVSFVFQDVYLFNDSLRNNILIARPHASEEDLINACELAGVTEIVKRLPDGWDTPCGEGGRALSGGERQRVSIARALLKQAPIVLFDEATSALDAENEANIVRSMQQLRKTSTVIAIAHKLETIKMADSIVVLSNQGTIAQQGTHEQLLASQGEYKKFWDKRVSSTTWKLA